MDSRKMLDDNVIDKLQHMFDDSDKLAEQYGQFSGGLRNFLRDSPIPDHHPILHVDEPRSMPAPSTEQIPPEPSSSSRAIAQQPTRGQLVTREKAPVSNHYVYRRQIAVLVEALEEYDYFLRAEVQHHQNLQWKYHDFKDLVLELKHRNRILEAENQRLRADRDDWKPLEREFNWTERILAPWFWQRATGRNPQQRQTPTPSTTTDQEPSHRGPRSVDVAQPQLIQPPKKVRKPRSIGSPWIKPEDVPLPEEQWTSSSSSMSDDQPQVPAPQGTVGSRDGPIRSSEQGVSHVYTTFVGADASNDEDPSGSTDTDMVNQMERRQSLTYSAHQTPVQSPWDLRFGRRSQTALENLRLESELHQARSQMDDLKAQKVQQKSKIKELQDEQEEIRRTHQKRVDTLKTEAKESAKIRTDLETALLNAEEDGKGWTRENKGVKSSLRRQKSQNQRLKASSEEQKTNLEGERIERERLQDELKHEKCKTKEFTKECQLLQDQVASYENLNEDNGKTNPGRSELAAAEETSKMRIEKLEHKLAKMRTQNTDLEGHISEQKIQLEMMRTKNTDLEKRISELKVELGR